MKGHDALHVMPFAFDMIRTNLVQQRSTSPLQNCEHSYNFIWVNEQINIKRQEVLVNLKYTSLRFCSKDDVFRSFFFDTFCHSTVDLF